MKRYIKHFITISRHKFEVMKACFRSGLYWQGLMHDFTKYIPVEFFTSARYFQGNSSPIDAEKTKKGYSVAWQHHKGHNPHHWQYWIDFEKGRLILLPIPAKYLAEMICDWIGAGKAYNKRKWTVQSYIDWYEKNRDKTHIHKSSLAYLDMIAKNVKCEDDIYKFIDIDRINENYVLDMMENIAGCANLCSRLRAGTLNASCSCKIWNRPHLRIAKNASNAATCARHRRRRRERGD